MFSSGLVTLYRLRPRLVCISSLLSPLYLSSPRSLLFFFFFGNPPVFGVGHCLIPFRSRFTFIPSLPFFLDLLPSSSSPPTSSAIIDDNRHTSYPPPPSKMNEPPRVHRIASYPHTIHLDTNTIYRPLPPFTILLTNSNSEGEHNRTYEKGTLGGRKRRRGCSSSPVFFYNLGY